jgi:signal transduction histidine kinase
MHYEIEVNVARRGSEPIWQSLVDDNAEECRWDNESDARAALVAEDYGEDARLMRYDNSGVGRVFPV